jgi:hypothetical protein
MSKPHHLLFPISVLLCSAANAQFPKVRPPDPRAHLNSSPQPVRWTDGVWTRKDKEATWHAYRVKVEGWTENAPAGGLAEKLRHMANEAEKRLLAKQSDEDAMFEWMTCAFALSHHRVAPSFRDERGAMRPLTNANRFDKLANSYEFTRMRFLVTAAGEPFQEYVPVGKKLLFQDPSDRTVKEILLMCLKPYTDEDDALGKRLAEELVKVHPSDRPGFWYQLGMTYWMSWDKNGRDADRQRSIGAFQKYIKLQGDPRYAKLPEQYIKGMRENKPRGPDYWKLGSTAWR